MTNLQEVEKDGKLLLRMVDSGELMDAAAVRAALADLSDASGNWRGEEHREAVRAWLVDQGLAGVQGFELLDVTTLQGLLAFLCTPEGAEADWSDLPTFGGPAPKSTAEVWSWDEDSLLVGTCSADLTIVPRGL